MDRDVLSAAIIQEMGAVFMAALAEALPATGGMDRGRPERHLRQMLRPVMGPVVEQIVALEAAPEALEPGACPACRARMRRVDRAAARGAGLGRGRHTAPRRRLLPGVRAGPRPAGRATVGR